MAEAASITSVIERGELIRLNLQVEKNHITKPLVGYLIVDGLGAVYGTLHGTTKCILSRLDLNVQSKKTKGGQSTSCGIRRTMIQREKHMHQVWKHVREHFFDENNNFVPRVQLLFLAGCGCLHKSFYNSPLLDERVRQLIQQPLLEIESRAEAGFHEAINQSSSGDSRLIREHRLLTDWMKCMARGVEDQVVFGVHATLQAYEAGVVNQLIMWDGLPDSRYIVQRADGTTDVHIGRTPPMLNHGDTLSEETSALIEWILETSAFKGTDIMLVTDITHQGKQFRHGFDGIGGYICQAPTVQEDHAQLERMRLQTTQTTKT